MGNKQSSRRKSANDVPDGKAKKDKRSRNKKNGVSDGTVARRSTSDIGGGAISYSRYQEEPELDIKLYRSYGNLATSKFGSIREPDPLVDVRVYRKSVGAYPGKSQTLPRSFGRAKSELSALPNGTLPLREKKSPGSVGGSDDRASKRSSTSSLGQRVQVAYGDFPATRDIIRKLGQFEDHFARLLVSKYRKMPYLVQLSTVTIAVKLAKKGHQTISLHDYLEEQSTPLDLMEEAEEAEEYVLKIPTALFHGIMHVRRDKITDAELFQSLARDLVTCVAVEAANEVSRVFEYQISLLNEETSIRLLADHAADCIMQYIQAGNKHLDRNTAIVGVVKGRADPKGYPKLISVIIGNRELKWELDDILKLPALRREMLLFTDDIEIDDDNPPWEFQFNNKSDPMLYGYRGMILEWDFVNKVYRVYKQEDKMYTEEVTYRYDDFHREYLPYRRLLGSDVMESYCQAKTSKKSNISLTEYLQGAVGGTFSRDEIQPVYRPLAPAATAMNFDNAVLDDVDLTRMQLDRADLRRASVRNTKLMLADASESNMEKTPIKGADISYSNIEGANLDPDRLEGVTVKHVSMSEKYEPVAKRLFSEDDDKYKGSEEIGFNWHQDETDGSEMGSKQQNRDEVLAQPLEVNVVNGEKKTKKRKKRRSRIVSDKEGHIVSVDQVIEQKQKDIAEGKEKEPEPEVIIETPSPTIIFQQVPGKSSERPVQLRKKKKRLNTSFTSDVGPASERNEETTLHNTSLDANLVKRTASASQARGSPPGRVNVEVIERPASATPVQSQPFPKSSPGSSHQAKAFSTTNIHYGHSGRPNRISPPNKANTLGPSQRLIKSTGQPGQIKSASVSDTYALGFVQPGVGSMYNNRRALSQAELEYIRRSQVFNMIKGLQIPNIDSNLPEIDPLLQGRKQEIADVTDLVTSGRIVTITGCNGIGKSSLTVAVGHEQQKKFVCPVIVDLRGAISPASVLQRLVRHFGLHFKPNELHMLYNWLNCHEQRLFFILDNLDLAPDDDEKMSDILDDLMFNVKDLRILCTSRRHFFRGQSNHEVYRLGDISSRSEDILAEKLSDLHPEGIQALAANTDHIPFAIHLVWKALLMEDIDSGKMAEALLNSSAPSGEYDNIMAAIQNLTRDDSEQQTLYKLGVCVARILENLPEPLVDLISRVSRFAASFDSSAAAKLLPSGSEEEDVPKQLDVMADVGLLVKLSCERYIIPAIVKLTVLARISDNGLSAAKYRHYTVDALKAMCSKFHSRESLQALRDFDANVDNFVEVLWQVMEQEDTYDVCGPFASLEYAIFLSHNIFEDTFITLYETMEQQACDKGDSRRQSQSLCCLAYHHIVNGHVEKAKLAVEKAYGIIHDQATLHETDKAFCLYCMALVHWENPEEQNKALMLAKKALDIFKLSLGMSNLRTLYVNEAYGWMLTQKESHQTARHFYNISDFVLRETLADHPMLIPGFDSRREIWDRLCLFQRSTDTAKLAADVARLYYGDHPLTAKMAQNHCEAIIKRGSLNDAIAAAVSALSVRSKVLGDHEDTAHSYKLMAYLMLRSGQYDEAVRFGQSAYDIYEKLDSNERQKIEVRNIIAQARYRLEYKSSNFIQLESKPASRKCVSTPVSPVDDSVNTPIGSMTTSVSTDV